jgi:hypothetical protein
MKLEYLLPRMHPRTAATEVIVPRQSSGGRALRVTCLLALAHRFEELVRSGDMRNYAQIARLGHVSRARISQILKLLTLAPSIQEHLLFLPSRIPAYKPIHERDLRKVMREPRWDRQRELFARLLAGKVLAQPKPPIDRNWAAALEKGPIASN